jgi:hypothetical protein
VAQAIGDTDGYTVYSGKAATIDKVAEAVSNGAVVFFDSHGATDYENPYNDFRQQDGKLVCPKCNKEVEDNRVAYMDAKGNPLEDRVAVAGPYKGKEGYTPENGMSLDIKTYYDDANIYTYTGLWTMSNRLGSHKINIYDVSLPTNVLSYEETDGYIALTPSYYVSTRYYSIPIEIYYPDDNNNHPEEIVVQIVSAEGVTKKITLDADDIINKTAVQNGREAPIYHCVAQGMKYSSLYQITATSRTYHGAAERVVYLRGDSMDKDGYSEVKIELEHLKQKDCNCLCHSILKPIWVAALNLLNTLFRVEYVCCDDMFANIGDQLNYGK